MVVWIAVLALLLALAALRQARRASRRLDALNQSYWELRYDYTRLRSRVARLDPDEASEAKTASPEASPPAAPSVSFVPLSSLKRKEP